MLGQLTASSSEDPGMPGCFLGSVAKFPDFDGEGRCLVGMETPPARGLRFPHPFASDASQDRDQPYQGERCEPWTRASTGISVEIGSDDMPSWEVVANGSASATLSPAHQTTYRVGTRPTARAARQKSPILGKLPPNVSIKSHPVVRRWIICAICAQGTLAAKPPFHVMASAIALSSPNLRSLSLSSPSP
ncbi:hypothetical protein N657DRAFT_379584 [Parathielavia appendiculata]|uniref:Uncharacterized protein n=1 Tax=Parathielavia appendiculata TaxID=2587402 RepID=A0AAN6U0M5_9PEZI|nr:hypothetical protein N657DRAFT_379584 [Parathielavia appendiculata]